VENENRRPNHLVEIYLLVYNALSQSEKMTPNEQWRSQGGGRGGGCPPKDFEGLIFYFSQSM